MFAIIHLLPMVLTALYFCYNSNAHKIMKRIRKDEGLIVTILVVSLFIGCWQLFWIIRLNPSIAKNIIR